MLTKDYPPTILAAPIRKHAVRYDPARFSEALAASLGVVVPERLRRAVPKRKAEYVAGRVCAREALGALSEDLAGEVAHSPSGSPAWPTGVTGSITHAGGYAWAAVALSRDVRALGIDTEAIVGATELDGLVDQVSTPIERAEASALRLDPQSLTTLLFSAKESVYKCLHPIVNVFFSFENVRVSLVGGRIRAELLVRLGADFGVGTVLDGVYEVDAPRSA